MLVTPTPDLGKVLNAMQEMKIEGDVNLATAVQIAQLALKHRQNKNQRQRVVIFIGSPIAEDKVQLVRQGRGRQSGEVMRRKQCGAEGWHAAACSIHTPASRTEPQGGKVACFPDLLPTLLCLHALSRCALFTSICVFCTCMLLCQPTFLTPTRTCA